MRPPRQASPVARSPSGGALLAEVGGSHLVGVADLVGGAVHQGAAKIKYVDPFADVEYEAHVVLHHEDAEVAVAHEPHQEELAELVALGGVQTRRRLVEEQEPGSPGDARASSTRRPWPVEISPARRLATGVRPVSSNLPRPRGTSAVTSQRNGPRDGTLGCRWRMASQYDTCYNSRGGGRHQVVAVGRLQRRPYRSPSGDAIRSRAGRVPGRARSGLRGRQAPAGTAHRSWRYHPGPPRCLWPLTHRRGWGTATW